MATSSKRPPRAMYITRATLERAPAEDVLKGWAGGQATVASRRWMRSARCFNLLTVSLASVASR